VTTTHEVDAELEHAEQFCCPLTHLLMQDPVMTCDGHTYDRVAIEAWLSSNDTSPMTGLELSNKMVTPNYLVRGLIESVRVTAERRLAGAPR
jgi:hypothetical protein